MKRPDYIGPPQGGPRSRVPNLRAESPRTLRSVPKRRGVLSWRSTSRGIAVRAFLKLMLRRVRRFCQFSLVIAFGIGCFRAGFEANSNDLTRPVLELILGIEDSPKSTVLWLLLEDKEGASEEDEKSLKKEAQ